MNNRIQVFECNDNNFIYKGEFGNLPYTTRSLFYTSKEKEIQKMIFY